MEIRQLRYFASIVEHGSIGKAALELGMVTSALSQQITRLENELATRLLQRTSTGVVPTDAGIAFLKQAQLALRHIDDAALAARQARLSGHVSVGMASSTAGVMGLAFMAAMRARYPDVRLRMVESLSGHLGAMLGARQIDLAILFQEEPAQRWSVMPLLDERLFVIGAATLPGMPAARQARLKSLGDLPLILPTRKHGLRSLLDTAFKHAAYAPRIVMEVDGLPILMDAVRAGIGATIQPGAALARSENAGLASVPLAGGDATRPNLIVSVSDDELSPAGLAARVLLAEVARKQVEEGRWPGAALRPTTLHKN
ncbi:LysR family transcriptional regulator [Herbaspirillum sp. SJZ099]|uniref:LysR family transcriptional regulator n=1 Tax=Herbaspirillum sp. SJZ099 TaxID=2572916 RepID=UPI00119EFA23|nr:LysR family transcriptional regulator [Herbaspirillum sp. SJZ099]TWC69603.1 LysR family tcuABC transcriptional regulator [Herbaspirillum sp. SJZ099]